ncbi:TPA: phage integrase N-terminal SAM-like domain-containing protein [Enterobacter roggenkampii]|nr:phage integrase N-terminal SAM-like domain-containing protein [Enterobacter roggenkampii]
MSFELMRESLKKYRDRLVDEALLIALDSLGDVEEESGVTATEKPRHTLFDALEEWCRDNRSDWKPRTEKLNRRSVELFIDWAEKKSLRHIEEISKQHISEFKGFLENHYQAPRSRQDALIKLQALFNFCVSKRDYLTVNP